MDKVRIESRDFVKTVVLNRPEKRNALDMEMLETLHEGFQEIADDARELERTGQIPQLET